MILSKTAISNVTEVLSEEFIVIHKRRRIEIKNTEEIRERLRSEKDWRIKIKLIKKWK